MVADEEGAAGVRRGGLFTSDDFLTCEGLSGGGVPRPAEKWRICWPTSVPLGLAKDCRGSAVATGKALLACEVEFCRSR